MESEESIMSRMFLLDQQIANMKQEIIDEEERDDYMEQEVEIGEDEDSIFNDLDKGASLEGKGESFEEGDAGVGEAKRWDSFSNNAMVFGSQITIDMANLITFNSSVTAPKQGENSEKETECDANNDKEVRQAAKSLEQANSVALDKGVVRTKGSLQKQSSSKNKENESPQNALKRVSKSPTDNESRWNVGARPPSKWAKAVYLTHPCLPLGWTFYDNEKGQVFFRNSVGKFIKNRRYALQEMLAVGGNLNAQGANDKFSEKEITFIRDGLTFEGWRYAEPEGRLPFAWLFKTYTHRIEGVDTDVMYLLSPNGSIVRSKARLKRDFRQLGVSEADLVKLLEFKPEDFHGPDDVKTLENPDPGVNICHNRMFLPTNYFAHISCQTETHCEVVHFWS